mgnify:CR=1 FL=1
MILVSLGTQDKPFERLLKAIDEAMEKGVITERVVAQIGQTKYTSSHMECFDFLDNAQFEQLLEECSLLITHGGVGSIVSAVNKGKVTIATPRLAQYGEHHNDHQKQIIERFAAIGCIIPLWEMSDLEKCLKEAKTFHPESFESNQKNFVNLIRNYLQEVESSGRK